MLNPCLAAELGGVSRINTMWTSLLERLFGSNTYTGETAGAAPELDFTVAGLALGVLALVLIVALELRRRDKV
jgi:hypothetical protein